MDADGQSDDESMSPVSVREPSRRPSAGLFHGIALVAGSAIQAAALLLVDPLLAVVGLAVGGAADLATTGNRGRLRGKLRRAGLGLTVRAALRAVLYVATLGAAGAPPWTLVLYGGGVVVLAVVGRAIVVTLRKVTRTRPAVGLVNLGDDLELPHVFAQVRAWSRRAPVLVVALELPLAVGLWLASELAVPAGAAVMLLTGGIALGAGGVTILWARRFQRSDRVARYSEQLDHAIRDLDAEVVVYFSADAGSTYQLAQWMPVFEKLDREMLIVLREAGHLGRLPPTRRPVLFCRTHRHVEAALASDPKVALYVGNAGRNIHFLRYGRVHHVFLNHGDSDKVSSANPVVRVYDHLFVAGEVAIERYRAAGIDLPRERFSVVGRPQLDDVLTDGQRIGEGPTTLLYAPTWEGYFDAADYSSLERMGVAMIRRLLADHSQLRIVFKPHPMSGVVRPQVAGAARQVERLLRDAGAPHIVAGDHPDLDLLAWFDRCDVLLSDISAVVTDFLQTDKPYLVTNPRGLPVDGFHERFPSHRAAYVVDPDLEALSTVLEQAIGEDPLAADRREIKQAVLGEHPDGPLATFSRALGHRVEVAAKTAARIRTTFAYD